MTMISQMGKVLQRLSMVACLCATVSWPAVAEDEATAKPVVVAEAAKDLMAGVPKAPESKTPEMVKGAFAPEINAKVVTPPTAHREPITPIINPQAEPSIMKSDSAAPEAPELMQEADEQHISIEISKGQLLRLTTPASAVIAADPAVADVQVISPSLVYINGKSIGETTVLAVDSQDHEILRAVVSVNNNLSKLNKAVKALVPTAKVDFRSVDGALVMHGDVDSPLQAEEIKRLASSFIKTNQTLVNMLTPRGTNQVMLKVRIAEVNRSELKRFGISLQNLSSVSNFAFGMIRGRQVVDATTSALVRNGTDASIYAAFNDGQNNLNSVIDALEDNGLVATLAEPTLTTQSGQPASFLAGGQFPVPSVTGSGSTAQLSVTYQPYGVSLAFTPVVLSKERISLQVNPEVSALSQTGAVVNAGFNIPALTTRKASTTVELGSGQSFAIAGLIQNDRNNDITKFPFLGDVPVLGALFRSRQFQHNQTELVIIVTPYIVDAVSDPTKLHDPTEGLKNASELESIVQGKLYKDSKEPKEPEAPKPAEPKVQDVPETRDEVKVPMRSGMSRGYILK